MAWQGVVFPLVGVAVLIVFLVALIEHYRLRSVRKLCDHRYLGGSNYCAWCDKPRS